MSLATFRKDISIEVYNLGGQKVVAYNVFRCWVSEYAALPQLDAGGNAVMITSIKLENEGWVRDPVVTELAET
jgi:phage tail-like protein